MKFEILANAYERMSATSSRIELTSVLVDLMKKTPISLIAQVCYLTQGKLYPDSEGIELGVAEKTATKGPFRSSTPSQRRKGSGCKLSGCVLRSAYLESQGNFNASHN
ncbi:MAG: hypothetical protein JRN20_22820 [Nitrososphaerota archaeon]|nr:hypothetical protein [Nitrososphaerota archaeon]